MSLLDFRLPDLGEGLTESEIVAWHVSVGDDVRLNQVIADVETAKAVVELPSPYAGRIARLYAEPGVPVEVGEPIVAFELEETQPFPEQPFPEQPTPERSFPEPVEGNPTSSSQPAEPAEPSAAHLVGYGPVDATASKAGGPVRRPRRAALAADLVPVAPEDASDMPTNEPVAFAPVSGRPATAARPLSTPPVRKLAHDLGVDLSALDGSGRHGLITRDDVRAAAAPRQTGPAPDVVVASDASTGRRETRTLIHGIRKATAAAMVASAFTAPQATVFLTVDVTETLRLAQRLSSDPAFGGRRIGVLAVTAKALCLALRANPTLNSRWDEAAGQIVQFHYVDLGIAVATPRGLIVPSIPSADACTLPELATAIGELAASARAGSTPAERLRGGTITISNVGVFGVDAGTPILMPGEAAILATGSVRREPREHEGAIALRDVMTLSLSFDHRLADGEQAAHLLTGIGRILRDPASVLAIV
ncbi:dihydrolipoamide acetyltransferase family protein [Rathayibacter sp. YIM 133350]|uniref:dihydrolipoamide acetyltransferase family protein n=1 Tax=Rathayibacter sp. YIM 133350 TaxID=3131992 RepID=UPI00307DA76A